MDPTTETHSEKNKQDADGTVKNWHEIVTSLDGGRRTSEKLTVSILRTFAMACSTNICG